MSVHNVSWDEVGVVTAHIVYMRECHRLLSLIASCSHQLGKHMETNEGHNQEARHFLAQTYDFASKHASETANWLAEHEATLAEMMDRLEDGGRE